MSTSSSAMFPLFELSSLFTVPYQTAIKLATHHQYDNHILLVLYCTNGYLLFYRMDLNGEPPVFKHIAWFENPKKQITCFTIDPSSEWLLIACKDSYLYLLPVSKILDCGLGIQSSLPWSKDQLTTIAPSANRGRIQCMVWWNTLTHKEIAILGTDCGEVTMINLETRTDLRTMNVFDHVTNLELMKNTDHTATSLLISTECGKYSMLMIERKSKHEISTVQERERASSMNYELIDSESIPIESVLAIDDLVQTDFQPVLCKELFSEVKLTKHEAFGETLVTTLYRMANVCEVYDSNLDQKRPLYQYHTLPNTECVCLTDHLIFQLSHSEKGELVLSALSRKLAERSVLCKVTEEALSQDAVIQQFSMCRSEPIVALIKLTTTNRCVDFSVNHDVIVHHGNLSWAETAYKEIGGHTVCDGVLIVTANNVYKCLPHVSPELMFLHLVLNQKTACVAERLGICLNLDMNSLYCVAGNIKLSQGLHEGAVKLFQCGRFSHVDLIKKYADSDGVQHIVPYLKKFLIEEHSCKRELANIVSRCLIQQCLRWRPVDKDIYDELRAFLRDNFDYDEVSVVEDLCRYRMYDLLLEVASSRNLINNAACLLSDKRILCVSILVRLMTSRMTSFRTLTDISRGFYLRVLPSNHCVTVLTRNPEFLLQNFDLVSSQLPYMSSLSLLHLALIVDPSQTYIRPILNEIVRKQKWAFSSMESYSSVSFAPFTAAKSGEAAASLLTVSKEDIIDLFLIVLLTLNLRMRSDPVDQNDLKDIVNSMMSSPDHAGSSGVGMGSTFDAKRQLRKQRNQDSVHTVVLSAGYRHSAAVHDGSLFTWGETDSGKLGHGDIIMSERTSIPCRVETLRFLDARVLAVSCGMNHTVALTEAGVYSWGRATYGQLGLGSRESQTRPVLVRGLSDNHCVAVQCGHYHTLVLTSSNQLYGFGWGVHGQLGFRATSDILVPIRVTSLDKVEIVKMCAGAAHSAVLTADGKVMTFGTSFMGQLGHGKTDKRTTPSVVEALKSEFVTAIDCGSFHTVCVTKTNKIYYWGQNPVQLSQRVGLARRAKQSGQSLARFSDVTKMLHLSPRELNHDILGRVVDVSCGGNFNLALTDTGLIHSWGRNDYGQLGIGNRNTAKIPHLIQTMDDHRVRCVAAGGEFSLALDQEGSIWVWGRSSEGQLGLDQQHWEIKASTVARLSSSAPAASYSLSTVLQKEVLVPTKLLGIPFTAQTFRYFDDKESIETSYSSLDSSNISDTDYNIERETLHNLPNFPCLKDPEQPRSAPYNPYAISMAFRQLCNFYNPIVMLRYAADVGNWKICAEICDIQEFYIQALHYRFVLVEGGAGSETAALDLVKDYTNKLNVFMNESQEHRQTLLWTDIIEVICEFWCKNNFSVRELENVFCDFLENTLLSISLFDIAVRKSLFPLMDRGEGSLPGLMFSSEFTTEVVQRVVRLIGNGYSGPYLDNLSPAIVPSRKRDYSVGAEVDDAKVWKEIFHNLKKMIVSNSHTRLSHHQISALMSVGQTTNNDPSDGSSDCVVFTCNHQCTLSQFQNDREMLFRYLESIQCPIYQQSISAFYKTTPQVALACPNCVKMFTATVVAKR